MNPAEMFDFQQSFDVAAASCGIAANADATSTIFGCTYVRKDGVVYRELRVEGQTTFLHPLDQVPFDVIGGILNSLEGPTDNAKDAIFIALRDAFAKTIKTS